MNTWLKCSKLLTCGVIALLLGLSLLGASAEGMVELRTIGYLAGALAALVGQGWFLKGKFDQEVQEQIKTHAKACLPLRGLEGSSFSTDVAVLKEQIGVLKEEVGKLRNINGAAKS